MQLSYEGAQNAVLVGFQKRFLPEDDSGLSESELAALLLSISDNSDVIKDLIKKHISPIYDKMEKAFKNAQLQYQAVANLPQQTGYCLQKKGRKLSAWQIFLTYANELVPDYNESIRKISLAKEYYAKMSDLERDDLCQKYMEMHPDAYTVKSGKQETIGKRGCLSGYSLFAKEWYKDQRRLHPEYRGLQSMACAQSWKGLTEEERKQYNARARAKAI